MKNLMKISEFSMLAGISRKLLIYYDKYGILHPVYTDPENGYRYYSAKQFETASVIVSLRQTGTSLEDIKKYLNKKSPERLIKLLDIQEQKIDEQIKQLNNIREMIKARRKHTKVGMASMPELIYIKYCTEELIFVGTKIPEGFDYDMIWRGTIEFLNKCKENNIPMGLPVNAITDISSKEYLFPSYFYSRITSKEGRDLNEFNKKKAGDYLICTAYAPYNNTKPIYERIFKYIEKNNLKTENIAFEEYLTDELTEEDNNKYLLQISVRLSH